MLSLRYGLDRGEPRTQGEVGELLDLTAERVRRIERDALIKLRRQLVGSDAHDLLASWNHRPDRPSGGPGDLL